jgi:hypothetical protein
MYPIFARLHHFLPAAVIVAGLLASFAIAFAPLGFLLSDVMPDDSFYYFEIARNILAGNGSTFDGLNPTNGYHPLWLLTILPIFSFFADSTPEIPIYAVLALSALLNAALGIVLLSIISRYTSSAWIQAAVLGVWFFNPFNLYEMISGLETPLSVFLIALFILLTIRYAENASMRRLVFVGVAAGLMMLARLDNVFYFIAFLAWLLYRDFRGAIPKALTVGVVASVIVLPWLIWNLATFGTVMTSSSVATTMVNHELIVQDHGGSWLQTAKAAIYSTDLGVRQVIAYTGAPLVFLILFGIGIGWLMFRRYEMRRLLLSINVEWFIFAGFILGFIVNASLRWSARTWYFVPFNIFLVLSLAWLLERLRNEGLMRRDVAAGVVCLTLALFYIGWSKELKGSQGPQRNMLAAAEYIDANLPDDAVVGGFNSGILGYFSARRIVNLDGLVNNEALAAMKERALWPYLKDENITYLADTPLYLEYRYKGFLGIDEPLEQLELEKRISASDDGLTIWRVR